jgi:hypothetical protein
MHCGSEKVAIWMRVTDDMFGMSFIDIREKGRREPKKKSQLVNSV